jgi:hypothetical protein
VLTIPYTRLREQYEKVKALSAEEELQWAREVSGVALGHVFAESVGQFRSYVNDEPFYPAARASRVEGNLSGTHRLACLLERAGGAYVPEVPVLGFRYVDREIVPARTTAKAEYSNGQKKTEFVRFDLLLASDVPIVAEVKIAGDSNAFSALAQVLTAAAELATPSQRQRLYKQYGTRLPSTADPRLDVYLLFVDYPVRSPVKMPILRETQRIASELVAYPAVRPYLRRVAALHLQSADARGVLFRPEFWYST